MRTEIHDSFGDLIVVDRMPDTSPNPLDVSVKFYDGDEEFHNEYTQMSLDPETARELAKALNDMADQIEKGGV